MLQPTVTFNASMTIEAARRRLEGLSDGLAVVVRSTKQGKVSWYAMRLADLRAAIERAVQRGHHDKALGPQLGLGRWRPDETHELGDLKRREMDRLSGILVDGDRALGVLRPSEPRQAARAGTAAPPEPPVTAGRRGLRRSAHRRAAVDRRSAAATEAGGDAPSVGSDLPDLPQAGHAPPAPAGVGGLEAYPRLDAPDNVAAGERFDLRIGLSASAAVGADDERMVVPTEEGEFDLIVQVIALGFSAPEGVRRFLHVRRDRFEDADVSVALVAEPTEADVTVATLEVEYGYEGAICGRAWRDIRIVRPDVPDPTGAVEQGSAALRASARHGTPDLTITVTGGENDGDLAWLFTSPHPIELPQQQVVTRLGADNAQSFAIKVMRDVPHKDGTRLINNTLRGTGRELSRVMPDELWGLLENVWRHVREAQNGAPSVLLVSSEPYVPWELAWLGDGYVDDALLVPESPPFLGAQLRVGRWIPPRPRSRRGGQWPLLPPMSQVDIDNMAVVVGDYLAQSGSRPLPMALEEGKALGLRYDAIRLAATIDDLDQLLENELQRDGESVPVHAIHFACHGEVDLANPAWNGIVLSDSGIRLDATVISGSEIGRAHQPFVFVNACQVGTAGEVLGDYGGLAGAFLNEGCRGFVAPLWSVNDQIAHDVALEFYECSLETDVPVAETLRRIRARFDIHADSAPASYLAYVFYGHPNLMLSQAS